VCNATPRSLSPQGNRAGIPCIRGWVGPRPVNRCGKSRPHRDSIPASSSLQRVAIPSELSRPPKFTFKYNNNNNNNNNNNSKQQCMIKGRDAVVNLMSLEPSHQKQTSWCRGHCFFPPSLTRTQHLLNSMEQSPS
jgi:hypothetical protein